MDRIIQLQKMKLNKECLQVLPFERYSSHLFFKCPKAKPKKYTPKTNAWTTKESRKKKKETILHLQTVPALYVLEKVDRLSS